MPRYTFGTTILLIIALFPGPGCAEAPPDRLVPVIDLLELTSPDRAPDGLQTPAMERRSWSFSNGLPGGWTAGPEGVRVVETREGLRLECDSAEPWLELHRKIDPLLYDRLVINLTPLDTGRPALQFAFNEPGRYRPYGALRKSLGPVGETQHLAFKIPPPGAAESVIHSTRFRVGGSGTALIRQAAVVPRSQKYIQGTLLAKEHISLSQEFKRCWRFTGGKGIAVSFTVPGEGARLGFASGTLIGSTAARLTVQLNDGNNRKRLLSVPVARPGGGWLNERVDLHRWAGRQVTLHFQVESEDPEAIHLIGGPTVLAAEQEARPNVLLILVDTLRADHLSGYGHRRFTSPHLDRYSRRGQLFTAAVAPASWTIPSVAATLTGRYPGSGNIGHGRLAGVPAGTPTLASLLGEAGYATAGFAANALLDDVRGFHRGFTHYFFAPYTDNQFTAAELNHRALSWFERHHDERFFCFLHYMDPHNPYDPPPVLPDPEDPDSPAAWKQGNVRALIAGQVNVETADDLERISRFYDEEVRYVDLQIGKLLAHLGQQGLLDDTLVLISADHGEELYDRGNWGHGFTLFEELIHVPLILRLPDSLNGTPGLISTPVSLVDILPTIADLTGIAVPDGGLPGRSLLEPIMDRYLRSGIWGKRAPDLYAVSHGPEKYILLKDLPGKKGTLPNSSRLATVEEVAGTEAFFDLDADPGEQRNTAGEDPVMESLLRGEMARWLTEMGAAPSPGHGEPATIDRELEEKLRAMGYMN